MKVFTIQPLAVYELLREEGVFHSRPLDFPHSTLLHNNENFKFALAYDWLIGKMIERGLDRPHPEVFPIWAYLTRPDLRLGWLRGWARDERLVLLTARIPDERVFLSDYDRWFICINYCPGGTVKAWDTFVRRCKRIAPHHPYDQPYPEPLHQELLDSWHEVVDPVRIRKKSRNPMGKHDLQGTFWELTADQVMAAVAYGEGRPREVLPLPVGRNARRRIHPIVDG